MARPRHWLHQDTVNDRARMGSFGACDNPLIGFAHCAVAAEAESHGASLGFVGDVGRLHLQRYRAPHAGGSGDRLGAAPRHRLGRPGDAIASQERLCVGLGEYRARSGERAADLLA